MQKGNKKSSQFRGFIIFVIALVVLGLGTTGAFGKETKALVDLNNASQQDLEGLKGVGSATAKKIIANRPYKSVDELSKAGISTRKIEALRPFVTCGPSSATPKPAKTETKPDKAPAASGKAAAKAAQAKAPAGLVDLNTADPRTLESLPGVGPKTAQEIIKGRPYKTVDDLSKVKGISKGKMDALKGMVTVSAPKAPKTSAPSGAPTAPVSAPAKAAPPSKAPAGVEKRAAPMKLAPGERVNINTASKEQLEALPGIGPVKAQAIIDGRPYKAPEDIMKVKGIKEGSFIKIKELITIK